MIHVQTSLVKQYKLKKLAVKTEKDVIFEMERSVIPTERILQEPLCMQHSLSMNEDQLYQGSCFSYPCVMSNIQCR